MAWTAMAALAVNASFETFGADAVWTPVGGAALADTVKVIVKKEVPGGGELGDFHGQPAAASWTGEVRAADLPDGTAGDGDSFVTERGTFTVHGEPDLDAEGLVWSLKLRKPA